MLREGQVDNKRRKNSGSHWFNVPLSRVHNESITAIDFVLVIAFKTDKYLTV